MLWKKGRAFTDSWRTPEAPWNAWVEAYEDIRVQFARFINADPAEIAILTSASAGLHTISWSRRAPLD